MNMKSSIVRGMPYATMIYEKDIAVSSDGLTKLPTIASSIPFGRSPVVDGKSKINCFSKNSTLVKVDHEIEIYFEESDYTWLVFFSEPVLVQCISDEQTENAYLQVAEYATEDCDGPLIVRAALLDSCTEGKNAMSCQEGIGNRLPQEVHTKKYGELLRSYSDFYPGPSTAVAYDIDDETNEAELTFDWDVRRMSDSCAPREHPSLRNVETEEAPVGLIMYALPHHMDMFDSSALPDGLLYCKSSMSGPACVVQGHQWSFLERLPRIGFQAPRPPGAQFIPQIAKVLKEDIDYEIPSFFERGAGDTYFSGKMLAKLGRILLIGEELESLCGGRGMKAQPDYVVACVNSTLPSTKQFRSAIDRLRSGVEIWINGTAETPFVYDNAWGGLVSCGCHFNGDGCENRAPDCPAFFDQGLNFGNGK